MRTWKRALVVSIMGASALLGIVVGAAPHAFADGAAAANYTQTYHDATDGFPAANPCTGAPAYISMTYNGVFHVTELTSGLGAGTLWATGTQAGDIVLTPNDPSQPSYTGQFAAWFGDNNNLHDGAETDTLEVHAIGSDGSTLSFHEVMHLSVSASSVAVFFDKPVCG